MLKSYNMLFWVSGFALGLMVCAYFACPLWKVAVPAMLVLSIAAGISGFRKMKALKDSL